MGMCYRQVRCLIRILVPEKIFYLSVSPVSDCGGSEKGELGRECDKGVKAKLIHTREIEACRPLIRSCQIPDIVA